MILQTQSTLSTLSNLPQDQLASMPGIYTQQTLAPGPQELPSTVEPVAYEHEPPLSPEAMGTYGTYNPDAVTHGAAQAAYDGHLQQAYHDTTPGQQLGCANMAIEPGDTALMYVSNTSEESEANIPLYRIEQQRPDRILSRRIKTHIGLLTSLTAISTSSLKKCNTRRGEYCI